MWRRAVHLAFLPYLVACPPNAGLDSEPRLLELVPEDALEIRVASQGGVAPYDVRVRSVNEFGAPTGPVSANITVNGQSQTVQVDAQGVGRLTLEQSGHYELAFGTDGVAHVEVYDQGWEGFGLSRAGLGVGESESVHALSDGYLVAGTAALWWVPLDGPAESVLQVPIQSGFGGVAVGQFDADGARDVVAWNTSTLFFLRGLPDGGVSWAKALRTDGVTITGLTTEDINRDGVLDLAVAIQDADGRSFVDFLQSDGLFRYQRVLTVPLEFPSSSIALGSSFTNGQKRLVSIGDGTWEWLNEQDDGSFVVFSNEPPFELPRDASLLDGGDFTGDLVDDTWIAGPRLSGQARPLHVVNLDSQPLSYSTRQPASAYVAIEDFQGDGHSDLWTIDDQHTLRLFTGANGIQEERTLVDLAVSAPFRPWDVIGDDVLDVMLAGAEHWYLYEGDVSDSGFWRPKPEQIDNLIGGVELIWPIGDADGDPASEDWVGIQVRDDIPMLKRWSREPGAEVVIERGRLTLGTGASGWVDGAVCSDTLWMLTGEALLELDLVTMTEVSRREGSGARVACWDGPSQGVALLRAGEVDFYDVSGVLLETRAAPNAQDLDVVSGELSEDPPTLGLCDSTGCEVMAWDAEPGSPLFVVSDGEGVGWSDAGPVPGLRGKPRVIDVDGDGLDDLLTVATDGLVGVVRATMDGPGIAEFFSVRRELSGEAIVIDGDGDGVLDLLAVDGEARLFVTPPAGL